VGSTGGGTLDDGQCRCDVVKVPSRGPFYGLLEGFQSRGSNRLGPTEFVQRRGSPDTVP
jgi:hypothetical protein